MTLWTVRAACLLYTLALAASITRRRAAFRLLWTLSFLCYAGHVVSAFAFDYHWSHQAAWAETARRTAHLFRLRWGGGLYFNYAFTVLWAADVLWLWASPAGYRCRPGWAKAAIHSYMAFMFVNGAVVFGSGWMRGFGLAALIVIAILWIQCRRPKLTSTPQTRQTIPL